MTRIVIHIGTPKTGTTAIQNALVAVEGHLADHDIHFIKSGRHRASHNDLCNAISRHGAENKFTQSLTREIDECLRDHPNRQLLLSSEMFSLLRPKAFRDALPQIASLDKKFVIYLRRQDHYVEAFYKQRLKNGRTSQSFWEFLASKQCARIADYAALLKKWQRAFPDAEFHPRLYDRDAFPDGDIVADFAQVLGIPDTELPATRKNTNVSPSGDVIGLLQALAPHLTGAQLRETFKTVKSMDIRGFHGKADLFSPEERHTFLQRFDQSNEDLRNMFFPTAENLFSMEEPKPAAEPIALSPSERHALMQALLDAAFRAKSQS